MTKANIQYRPEIDGLRTIAVMSVIFYHAGFSLFSGGFVGVDIFFVISGFLISSIIGREMASGRFSFGGFYERRIRRILPALFFVCAATLLPAWYLLSPEQLKDFGQSLVATMGFAANGYFYLQSGYFSPDVHTLPMIHMWSLAVEEQYYLAFPVALLVLYRFFSARWRNVFIAVALLLSLAASIKVQSSWASGNFFLTPFRAWELLAGSLLALGGKGAIVWFNARPGIKSLANWAGLALLVGPIMFFNSRTIFPGMTAILPVSGTMLLIAAATGDGLVRRTLASAPMVGIGLISYSAYLWHQPLFAFVLIWLGAAPHWAVKLGLIALTLVMAWVSWRWVEQPFRSRARFTRRQMFGFAGTGSAFFVAIGLVLHVQGGFPSRYDAPTLALADTMAPSPNRIRCHTEGTEYRKPANACRYFGTKQDWALLGDSHAIELGMALAERLRPLDRGIVHLSFSGCQPAFTNRVENPGCAEWTRESVAWLTQQPEIRDILLVYRHNFHLYGDQTQTYPDVPDAHPALLRAASSAAARRAYWRSFRAQVSALTKSGKRVHVVASVPDLPVPAERLLFLRSGNNPSFVDAKWHRARSAATTAELRSIAAMPGVSIIDPAAALCTSADCRWRDDNKIYYFDDNHLSMAGARIVIDNAIAAGDLTVSETPR